MRRRRFEQFMDEHRWDALAAYNSEVARGLMHTPEYSVKMIALQREFNEEQAQWARDHNAAIV